MDEDRRLKEEQSQQELNFMRENMQSYEKEVIHKLFCSLLLQIIIFLSA